MPTFVFLTIVLVLNYFDSTAYFAWGLVILWIAWQMLHRGEQITIPRTLIQLCAIPMFLLIIALPGAAFHPFRDVARDLWLFINPITYIVFGYLLFEKVKSWSQLLQPFILVGLVASLYAVWNAYNHLGLLLNSATVEEYHHVAGYGFAQAMVPIVLILMSRRFNLPSGHLDRKRSVRVLLYIVGGIAISLSFSRTIVFVMLAGLLLTINFRKLRNNLVLGRPATILLAMVIFGILVVAASRSSALFAVRQTGSFTDKLANIPEEVKIHHFDTFDEINADWRGFEAYRALVTYERFSPREAVMGGGLGTLVDLGFPMDFSATESYQFIPTTHNGYAYLLVKTGPVGLLLFFFMLLLIARRGWLDSRSRDPNRKFVGYLLLWTAITLLMTQAVVNGFFNRTGVSPNLLLLGAAYASLRAMRFRPENESPDFPMWLRGASMKQSSEAA